MDADASEFLISAFCFQDFSFFIPPNLNCQAAKQPRQPPERRHLRNLRQPHNLRLKSVRNFHRLLQRLYEVFPDGRQWPVFPVNDGQRLGADAGATRQRGRFIPDFPF